MPVAFRKLTSRGHLTTIAPGRLVHVLDDIYQRQFYGTLVLATVCLLFGRLSCRRVLP
jgi:hypothetical protein